ncbi:MAG: hypothetical protein JWO15_3833 [Sphingomonadales bacterium]|nr:hypothetical protein [Sphingomonadales bacterium]
MAETAVAAVNGRAAIGDPHDLVNLSPHRVRRAADTLGCLALLSVLADHVGQRLVDRLTAQPAVKLLGQYAASDLVAAMTVGSAWVRTLPGHPRWTRTVGVPKLNSLTTVKC